MESPIPFLELCTALSGLLPENSQYSQWFDTLAKSFGYEGEQHYAVVIDAGSSGTRVHAYRFRVPFACKSDTRSLIETLKNGVTSAVAHYPLDKQHVPRGARLQRVCGPKTLELMEEYFEPTNPGLSSYADDPAEGAETIVRLINNAKHLVPEESRKHTPLLVRATAGLRLLPKEKATTLIDHVSVAISRLGFDTSGNSVDILDGSDEGIGGWYAINLLKGLTNGPTMAALDLGGGSTQITYQIDEDEMDKYPAQDLHVFYAAGKEVTLFSHSFLHLGIFAARYGILRLDARGETETDEYTSVCVHPTVKKNEWIYFNKKYFVSGAPQTGMSPQEVYDRCHKLIKEYVMMTLDFEPQEPPKGEVAAMSFFYYLALMIGIIDENGGPISVQQYRSHALRSCSTPYVDQPWACLDLVYIVTLLQDAYKMQDSHTINVYQKIDGHEVSWVLGVAYSNVLRKISGLAAAIRL